MISFDDPRLIQSLASGGRIYVGFSGGVDSLALLHMLALAIPNAHRNVLTAIHVHHGLSPNADDWLVHCQTLCAQLKVRFISEYVQVPTAGSLEENARKARYKAFEKHLVAGDVLAQGHHANDQAETLLFRLERGAGTRGMQGIPDWRSIGQAWIWRPLLSMPRQALEDYVIKQGLQWIEDESNGDHRYRRNFLRHQVLHPWQIDNPKVAQSIASSAKLIRDEMSVYERLAYETLAGFQTACGGLRIAELPSNEVVFWLSRFLRQFNVSLTKSQLDAVVTMFFSSKEKQPYYRGNGFELSRFEGMLYVLPKIERQPEQIVMPREWCTRLYDEIYCDRLIVIKGRPQGTELLLQNGHHRSLKKWLQDQRIPLWWREQLPYVFENGTLVAIGDLWRLPTWEGVIEWKCKDMLPWPQNTPKELEN